MARSFRPILVAVVINVVLVAPAGVASAEQGGGSRVIVLPLRGPGGAVARNKIATAIEPGVSYVAKIGAQGAQRPARTARLHKADAMVGGRIRCPGKACVIDVMIYKASGQIWTKGTERAPRAKLAPVSADLAVTLLEEVGVLGEGAAAEPDEEEPDNSDNSDNSEEADYDFGAGQSDQASDNDFDSGGFGDEEEEEHRPQRGSKGHDLDAVEIYLDSDITVVRNLCVDLNLVGDPRNDTECSLDDPSVDDRTYSVSPFASLGFRVNFFPGALIKRRAWWAGIGMYIDYGHSLSVTSQREYETPEDADGNYQRFVVEIGTSQQDVRAGLVYRLPIPMGRPTAPQLRFMLGYSMYDFFLEDEDYPTDVEVRIRYRESNPYLPAFRYHAFDLGLEFRMPIRGFIFPYTSLMYRAGLSAGQAERVYGAESSINGVDWELGVRVEIGLGIRIGFSTELIWYGTTFAGSFSPEDETEASIWGASIVAGDSASDLIFRLRIGVGWAF